MKITKYEHACLAVEENDKTLIIDPGIFSSSLPDLYNVVVVVITHMHQDHFDPDTIKKIAQNNSGLKLFTVNEVAQKIPELNPTVVDKGDEHEAGPFKLEFFGGMHAEIHRSFPRAQNLGVLVNDKLYYPGDSFSLIKKDVEILALPASAPWLKIGQAMDFVAEIKPKKAFPTHNALLSEEGAAIHDRILGETSQKAGVEYQPLFPGQTISVD